jgi:hypothetical protein
MDTFTLIIGIIGLVLFAVSLVILINAIISVVKRKMKFRKAVTSLVMFLILFGFGTSFIYLALFLQTFSRYTQEDKIGWIYAEDVRDGITMVFYDEQKQDLHYFNLQGDQWIVEGYFLRWSLALRWLGAGAYYRVTRFTGRWEEPFDKPPSVYQIHPERGIWKMLLQYGDKLPFVDAAYGIGAFQYPARDTFSLYINDTGFIRRKD